MRKIFTILIFVCSFAYASCGLDENSQNKDDTNEVVDDGNGDYTNYTDINGTKISDKNNAVGLVYDADTKKGIAGVPVSDGFSFTVTDENGVYQMSANRYCRLIYITIPSEYEVTTKENSSIPLFYSTTTFNRNKMNRNDFALKKLPDVQNDWTLVAVGDPQCKNANQQSRYLTETISDIKRKINSNLSSGKYKNAYALTLGDIVNDTPNMFPAMEASMSDLKVIQDAKERTVPFFQCIGNHDHNTAYSTAYESLNTYMQHFGPVDYSFNRGKVHIIVMDNVLVNENKGNTWKYDAGLTDLQWKWLQDDIKLVKNKEDKMVIFACHIPFRAGTASGGSSVNLNKHYSDVLTALTEFKEAHIMIGHTHYTQNYIHTNYKCKGGLPIYEHIHCAASGAWWSGNLSTTGSPNGFSFYEITGNTMKNWVACGTNLEDNNAQMRVYSGNDIYGSNVGEGANAVHKTFSWTDGGYRDNSTKLSGQTQLKDCLIATIWNDDDKNWDVKLEYLGNTYQMQRVTNAIVDMCVCAWHKNNLNKSTSVWFKPTKSVWYVKVPGLDPSTSKGWTVKATQTIPGSGTVNVYTCSDKLQTDYSGFAH